MERLMEIKTINEAIDLLKDKDWDNELWCDALFAQISRISYLDGKPAKKIFKQLGFIKHKFIENDGAQAHIIEDESNLVFAFRGTEPTQFNDIAADLKAWKMKSRTAGRVHDGFFDETNKLWPMIENYPINKKKIWICGHSLGGAMATICATRLCSASPMLYTYGSPRVGDRRWLKNNNSINHHRFVNNNDIVPKVPLAMMGFKHQGLQCYINYYGNIRHPTFWQKTKDQFRARRRAWSKGKPFSGFTDHSISRYSQKLLDLYLSSD